MFSEKIASSPLVPVIQPDPVHGAKYCSSTVCSKLHLGRYVDTLQNLIPVPFVAFMLCTSAIVDLLDLL